MTDRPMHVCRACGSVDDDLGRYIEQLEAERDEQATLAKTMARKYAYLQRTIAIQDGSSKKGKESTELCELWLNSPCVSDKARSRVRIEPGSDRHKLGVKMLQRYPLRSDDPQALTLEKAVRGLIKFPYIVKGSPFPGMRAPHGQKHERYADLQYAIRDDKHIEQCCQLADMNPEEQLNRAVLPATQVETVAMRRVQRRDRDRPAVFRPQPRPLISLEQARQIAPFIANHDPIDSNHPSDPFEQFLDNLDAYGFEYDKRNRDQARYQCPGHDDHHPSLDITRGRDGKVLMTCRSHQCPVDVICARVDWPMKWLWPYEGRLWAAA